MASLVDLFQNVTSPQSLILIEPGYSAIELQNNETAYGWRNSWEVWVWPFWQRTPGGAAVDGEQSLHCCVQGLILLAATLHHCCANQQLLQAICAAIQSC